MIPDLYDSHVTPSYISWMWLRFKMRGHDPYPGPTADPWPDPYRIIHTSPRDMIHTIPKNDKLDLYHATYHTFPICPDQTSYHTIFLKPYPYNPMYTSIQLYIYIHIYIYLCMYIITHNHISAVRFHMFPVHYLIRDVFSSLRAKA